MPRRVEALKPQAEFAERTGGGSGGSRRPRTRIVGRVLKQHCCGMEAERRASDETLCQVLNGDAEDLQGEEEIRWAFETMGPDALAALYTEGKVSLDRLAAAKRRSQPDPKQEDRANAWLNTALAKEQGLKLEQQIQDIAAHAKRAPLAILAGAGISKPAPSGVPLYHELAIELAGATPRQAAEDPGACFDRAREERGEAIYEQAAERIRGRTEPNELHRRVAALHSAAGSRTIITTNWDELIEAAGTERGESLRVWPEHERGPEAGHRASGLVHLHGTASEPGGMLLTKTDLERHYTQERERRFVGELVGDRSMLCIGYSHRDVMIRKIQESVAARERAREGEDGQGSRKTFSLVKRESGKPGWEDDLQRLDAAGIEPVLYDRHEEVPEILDRVARAIAQDAEAERRRLEATAKQGPRPDTDWSEIRRLLEEGGPRLEHFLREAAPEAWAVHEFMQAGGARVLREETGDPASAQVSHWLCNGMDGERLRTVLWMAAKAGERIGPALRYWLARSLGDSETVGDAERERGALFLIGQCESAARGMNGHLPLWRVARRCSEAGRYEASIQGWAAVAKVYAAAGSKHDLAADGSVKEAGRLEPRLNVEGWGAKEFYAKAVRPWMEQIHEAVWDVCAHALERQQRILETACGEEDPGNHWSGIRSAIEEHEQDGQRYARGLDALIDAARDALESGGRTGKAGREKWEARIRQAGASKNVLLNRLAIHGVTESGHWSADRKVRWLGESGLLGNPWCVHEAYRLLREHWKRARGAARQAVGRRICRLRIRGGSREGNESEQYVLLGWIERWGPLTREMKARQGVLQSRHRAWEMPAHPPDFQQWHSGVECIGPVAPPGWDGRQLVDDWKTRGRDALDRVIEGWENPAPARTPEQWLHGPNEEGRRESAGDAIRLDREWGVSLAKRLIEREKWDHEAWCALCRELPKRMVPTELLEWAGESWWREVGKGKCSGALGGIPRGLATHLREGNGEEVDVRKAVETLEEWALGTLKGDERPRGGDWTNHCIGTTAGTAVEGIIGVAAGEAGGPEDRDAAFAALERLWNASPAMRNHVATLCTNKLDVLAQRGEEWVGAHLVQAVEDEGSEELRRVVWGAMEYTRWTQKLGKMLKNAMERELMHEEAPGETDACAERYAWSMLRDVLDPSEGGRGGEYESWKVAELPAGRRATVVAELAHHLWTNEETRARDAWGRILLPLWRDVCDHAEGGTSEGEQSSFLHCFAFLNEGQQDEFRACFRRGPAVAPERFLDVDFGPKEVENRMAALEVALHCAGGYGGHDAGKWTAALETIAGWARAPRSPEEGTLAYNVLAKTGHTM